MFKYTLDNKRYHTLNYYYKNKYGRKTFKVSLNGGFSCPNKEKTGHGCIFCSRLGSGDFAGDSKKDLLLCNGVAAQRVHCVQPMDSSLGKWYGVSVRQVASQAAALLYIHLQTSSTPR